MSQVITIIRQSDKSKISFDEILHLIESDKSLSFSEEKIIQWSNPNNGKMYFINIEESSLWSDNINIDTNTDFFEKLQFISKSLNAQLISEEGDDITDNFSSTSDEKPGIKDTLGCFIGILSLPFLLILFVLRLPLLIWKIMNETR